VLERKLISCKKEELKKTTQQPKQFSSIAVVTGEVKIENLTKNIWENLKSCVVSTISFDTITAILSMFVGIFH
jgi:spore maturation protein SpmB